MNRFKRFALWVFVILLSGCQRLADNPPILKNGAYYGVTSGVFTGRYWDYYERGLSFADGQFWKQAEQDFRQAIAVFSKDERRIRTYGRHVTDYLPHRELGVALYRQQRYAEAVRELETSLETVSTARADFYLDKARKAFIEQEQSDVFPPEIFIRSPQPDSAVRDFVIPLTGEAADDQFVKTVRINGQPIYSRHSEKQIEFHEPMPVLAGKNEYIIEAEDLTGKISETRLIIYGDRIGPALNVGVSRIVNRPDAVYQVRGFVYDGSGVRVIRINGNILSEYPGKETILDQVIAISPGQHQIMVSAEDVAGNITEVKLALSDHPPGWSGVFAPFIENHPRFSPVLLASADDYLSEVQTGRWFNTREQDTNELRRRIGTYHALIIGINEYAAFDRLVTAVNDAEALRDILIRRYGFSERRVILRTDAAADFETLNQDINSLCSRLTETDNLLVYFAGHGDIDPMTQDGYWIPADGRPNDPSTWITNSSIRQRLGSQIRAKHVMVISDSCYSGFLVHPPKTPSPDLFHTLSLEEAFLNLAIKPSREAAASGGIQPVADTGTGKHSAFSSQFLKALEENQKEVVTLNYLFKSGVWKSVYDATAGRQEPGIGLLNPEADKGGRFVLTLKSEDQPSRAVTNVPEFTESEPISGGDLRFVTEPPVIAIEHGGEKWQGDRISYDDQALLQITARSAGGIQWIKINGEKIIRRPGRYAFHVNYIAALKEGVNEWVIMARDQSGNIAETTVRIERRIKTIYQPNSRMSVVMAPFDIRAESPEWFLISRIEAILQDRIVSIGRFSMKTPESSGSKQAASRLFEQAAAYFFGQPRGQDIVSAARNAGADYALRGTVIAGGGRLDMVVSIHDIQDPESDHEMVSVNVYEEDGTDSETIRSLCHAAAFRLKEELPLMEGQVITTQGKTVIVDFGKKDRIKKGMQVVFFEDIPGADAEECGAAKITQVHHTTSHAKLFPPHDRRLIRSGMKLATR